MTLNLPKGQALLLWIRCENVVNHHRFINITNMFVCTKGVKVKYQKSKVKIMGELRRHLSSGADYKCHIVLNAFKRAHVIVDQKYLDRTACVRGSSRK